MALSQFSPLQFCWSTLVDLLVVSACRFQKCLRSSPFSGATRLRFRTRGLGRGVNTAIQGGSVVGRSLVSLGVLALCVLIELFKLMPTPEESNGDLEYFAKEYQLPFDNTRHVRDTDWEIHPLLFSDELELVDDKCNLACIADNVDDNVDNVAGLGTDLFGSIAEATCACRCVIRYLAEFLESTGVSSAHLFSWNCGSYRWWCCTLAILRGLWSGLFIGFVTDYLYL